MTRSSSHYDVVGLGVSTLDLLMVVDRLPGEEAVQQARQSALQGGGPVATALVTLARLGARTAMLDRVGDDWRGREILEEFEREGVSTRHLLQAEGRCSSIATILVRQEDGARSIVYSPGDADELSAADLPGDVIASSRILHLNGRHLGAALAAATKAKEHGVLVSFDGGSHRYRPGLDPLIGLTDICIAARDFAFSFSGEDSIPASALRLLRSGPAIVVITAGPEGSWIFTRDGNSFHQPAFDPGQVVDTTGAGDAYHGGFLFGLARGYALPGCAALGSAVAALNVRHLGGRTGLPRLDEAFAFLAENGIPSAAAHGSGS